MAPDLPLNVRYLGCQSYLEAFEKMQTFTNERTADTPDELWVLEHEPVFTQGQAGKAEHLLVLVRFLSSKSIEVGKSPIMAQVNLWSICCWI